MKYNKKEIMKKAWEIKKENEKNIFGLCLKMAWAIAKREVKAVKLPELQGSQKQVAWAKDIREKVIAKFDMDNLLTDRGELKTDWAEDFMGRKFLLIGATFFDKTDWAKKLTEKREQLFGEFRSVYPNRIVKRDDPRREAYRTMRLHTNRLYAEYAHELGLEFVSSLTKATDFIDRRKYV